MILAVVGAVLAFALRSLKNSGFNRVSTRYVEFFRLLNAIANVTFITARIAASLPQFNI